MEASPAFRDVRKSYRHAAARDFVLELDACPQCNSDIYRDWASSIGTGRDKRLCDYVQFTCGYTLKADSSVIEDLPCRNRPFQQIAEANRAAEADAYSFAKAVFHMEAQRNG